MAERRNRSVVEPVPVASVISVPPPAGGPVTPRRRDVVEDLAEVAAAAVGQQHHDHRVRIGALGHAQ
ncbi:hypothetical protein, partial [Actinomadura sp. NPDC000929]|uniref:hypothetical protein n=1 Tax=Actinomadura sp. NPDC000929 TaxID=3154517 RepID=UPI003392DB57